MVDSITIAADPAWLPHRIDPQSKLVEFVRIEHDELSAPGFLADSQGRRISLPWSEVEAMKPEAGPLNFIFHTAFCRSTLLARALNIPGHTAGLNEPGVLASLVNAGPASAALTKPILDLLSRAPNSGGAVFVKPSNHSNMLIPRLLAARPDSKAILMTNSLSAFLRSVIRKGMMGRRWGRQLYLELQNYAGLDFGMDPREIFLMTDLQAAALGWFLNQRWFEIQYSQGTGRMRVLDGDRFADAKEQTLSAVIKFAQIDVPSNVVRNAAQAKLFSEHAKLGGSFEKKEANDKNRSISSVNEEEIGQVAQWIDIIAQQAGLKVPVSHNLF